MDEDGKWMTGMARLFFPPEPRHIPGERWTSIAVRAVHLVGVAGIGGGFLLEVPDWRWLLFWDVAVGTGVLLVVLELARSGRWLFQLKGLAVGVKLLLLWAALQWPVVRAELFCLAVLLSAVLAHAPPRVRGWYWVPWPRARSGSRG